MLFNKKNLEGILAELKPYGATLVAVSKLKPAEAIREVYNAGQRVFGENYVQELAEKAAQLPRNIEWHFIGHLQSNKVKVIAPFVSLIHGVDSFNLLKEINKQALKNNRVIDCLLQIHIAQEETKFGLSIQEAEEILLQPEFSELKNICVRGLMGMATLTENKLHIRKEFKLLSEFFHRLQANVYKAKKLNGHAVVGSSFEKGTKTIVEMPYHAANFKPQILSMGMTSDYKIALEEGSTMVRIGTAIFGER